MDSIKRLSAVNATPKTSPFIFKSAIHCLVCGQAHITPPHFPYPLHFPKHHMASSHLPLPHLPTRYHMGSPIPNTLVIKLFHHNNKNYPIQGLFVGEKKNFSMLTSCVESLQGCCGRSCRILLLSNSFTTTIRIAPYRVLYRIFL